jgi:hypothetical protein
MKVTWIDGDLLFVVTSSTTSNKKIADPKEVIVQTYTYSLSQLESAKAGKVSQGDFFLGDKPNCMDCPLSRNSGNGKCYTHKYLQFSGFLSSLRSTKDLSELTDAKRKKIVEMCEGRYVRFGTYGEPSLMPIDLVESMVEASKCHTGYTHQWRKPWCQPYSKYFMASAHSDQEASESFALGFRAFIVKKDGEESNAVQCPASKEAGYVSTCSKCKLCSGRRVKTEKHIKINEH